jgi:hypothetical protein
MPRCPRCLSIALVCSCLAQGVKAPSAAVVSWIVSPSAVVVASSSGTASITGTMVNTVIGKVYDVSRPTETILASIWPPPDRTKT